MLTRPAPAHIATPDRNADQAELEIVDMGVNPPSDRPEGKYFFGAASYFESVITSFKIDTLFYCSQLIHNYQQ